MSDCFAHSFKTALTPPLVASLNAVILIPESIKAFTCGYKEAQSLFKDVSKSIPSLAANIVAP